MGWFDMGNRPDTAPMAGLDGSAEVSRRAAAVDLAFICATIVVLHIVPRSWICPLFSISELATASIISAGLDLLVAAAIAGGLLYVRRLPLAALGVRGSQSGGQVLAGLWAAFAVHAVTASVFVVGYVLPAISWAWANMGAPAGTTEVAHYTRQMLSQHTIGTKLVFFGVLAIEEELLFRGLLLRYLAYLTRDAWVAILVSSLVFGALHLPMSGQTALIALWMGLVLGTFYMRQGSLLTVAVAHFLFNVSQSAIFALWR